MSELEPQEPPQGPEIWVNGELVGHGLPGMLKALPIMLAPDDDEEGEA